MCKQMYVPGPQFMLGSTSEQKYVCSPKDLMAGKAGKGGIYELVSNPSRIHLGIVLVLQCCTPYLSRTQKAQWPIS